MPVRARWHESWIDENGDQVPALKDLKEDIGNMLKAQRVKELIDDLEDGVNCGHAATRQIGTACG